MNLKLNTKIIFLELITANSSEKLNRALSTHLKLTVVRQDQAECWIQLRLSEIMK